MRIPSLFIVVPNWKQHRYPTRMTKQPGVHPYQGILLYNKKEQTINTGKNLNDTQENMLSKKKPMPKDYVLYDYIYISFLKRQNYRNGEQVSGYQNVRGGGGAEGKKKAV